MQFDRLLLLKIFVVLVIGFMLFIFILIRALDGRGEGFVKDRPAALKYVSAGDPNFLEFKTKFGGDIVDYYEMKRDKK
ncbi:hypothetical protein F-VV10_0388 [Faustovirus]|nr:hypothetical protein F-VV10_0388 [Faustovirus]